MILWVISWSTLTARYRRFGKLKGVHFKHLTPWRWNQDNASNHQNPLFIDNMVLYGREKQSVPSRVAWLEPLFNHAYLHNAEQQYDEEVFGSHFLGSLLNLRRKGTESAQPNSAVYIWREDNRVTWTNRKQAAFCKLAQLYIVLRNTVPGTWIIWLILLSACVKADIAK